MNKLKTLIVELEKNISSYEFKNEHISKQNVGWQIDHSLLTIHIITLALEKSNPKDYKWRFNLSKLIVFNLNKIPRGKAKAPTIAIPKENISIDSLQRHFASIKLSILKLENMSKDSFFTHPYFGDLKLKSAIKLLNIHTQHHLKIIQDVLRSKEK